jgi:ABC-type phosphate transport system auxiliary subunit
MITKIYKKWEKWVEDGSAWSWTRGETSLDRLAATLGMLALLVMLTACLTLLFFIA